jgi:hypothetical protein
MSIEQKDARIIAIAIAHTILNPGALAASHYSSIIRIHTISPK